eukprot:Nitzschia sp. Nitz4//scaffold1_size375055//330463//333808//NITZ4_000334-RA/size375055-augustus-gene-0.735-mRNA-1//-1//CDS//3329541219//6120//frame0
MTGGLPLQRPALPLFDMFLDLPHPAAATMNDPPRVFGAPSTAPEMLQELQSNLSRIGRFAFPEFEDATAQNIPRDTELNRFSQYAMQPKSFQHYTFSLQLQSGVRVHGHVRRYLPLHPVAKSRYDVGRRGERALVLLTRANGGDAMYAAILRTLDAVASQKVAMELSLQPHGDQPDHWFLHALFDQHRHLCATFASLPRQNKKPMVLTVSTIEVGPKPIPAIELVDNSRFLVPTSLLGPISSNPAESMVSSPILPLLRVLGVQNTLRLLSGMVSESRILLTSVSPTRLAQCARATLSILSQGLLNWQHLFIPVLPPHLFQYLAAPVPYLIGMLTSMMPRLEQARPEGLGEMIIIHLDTAQMETRGIHPSDVARKIPDLFRASVQEPGAPPSPVSSAEYLAQDLVDLLKVDKRSIYGESTLSNVSETAAKASKAVKTGFLKLKEKGRKFLQSRSGSSLGEEEEFDNAAAAPTETSGDARDQDTFLPDFIYTQGVLNEATEEEARIAFASFFLSLFGNMRWYLSVTPGQVPHLDRQRFLQQKRSMGDGENTAIWPLLENFCQTQMLEEFAKSRVEEIRTSQPVTSDSPLFTQCTNYHLMHNIDFSLESVRRVARQVAQNSPSRDILQTKARRTAMLLTSNKTYEGDYNRAVATLVEQCRECNSVLCDVMSVVWVRLRDCKGLHWKHGFQALQILRNLLYHGPLAAIAEATDGLDKIRVMKFYNDNMRSQICTQIRQVASQVYNLLVDRTKLFAIRRLCINKRRTMRLNQAPLTRDSRARVTTPFHAMHRAFCPTTMDAAKVPGAAPARPQFAAEQGLIDFSTPPAPVAPAPTSQGHDPFGFAAAQPPAAAPNSADDLAGLFGAQASIGGSEQNTTGAVSASNPFDAAPTPAPAAHDPFATNAPPAVAPAPVQGYPQGQSNQFPPQQHPGAAPYQGQQYQQPYPGQAPAQGPPQQQQQGAYPGAQPGAAGAPAYTNVAYPPQATPQPHPQGGAPGNYAPYPQQGYPTPGAPGAHRPQSQGYGGPPVPAQVSYPAQAQQGAPYAGQQVPAAPYAASQPPQAPQPSVSHQFDPFK